MPDPYELGFELAGQCGVEPWRFSLRELYWMSWGRSNNQWNHTASLMWLLASINCDPDGPRPQLAHYHPYLPTPVVPVMPPEMLANLLQSLKPRAPEGSSE